MGQSKKLNKQPSSLSPLVQLAGIRKCFDGKEVIPQLDLTINNGEFLTLLLDKPLLEAARDLGASKLQTFIRIIIPLTMPGIIAGCLLVMLPAMGLFYVSDLMGGAKNLLIGNVIKVQFLNIRDWPFGAATSITLTIVMGLMLLVYWRASRLLNKKVSELDD